MRLDPFRLILMPEKRDEHISEDAVRRATRLARLSFSMSDTVRIEEKARSVIDYFRKLGELDTEGIEPTSHAVSVEGSLRSDEAAPSGIERKIVEAAPERDGDFVQVPKVIEGE